MSKFSRSQKHLFSLRIKKKIPAFIRKKFQLWLQNTFLINVITLLSGTAFSQGILLVATPFLTRLYTPNDYGLFGLYTGIIGILGIISTLQYEVAIILPKRKKNAIALLLISIFIASTFLGLSSMGLLLIRQVSGSILASINPFAWLIPGSIFFAGILQAVSAFCIRSKLFSVITISKILQTIGTISFQFFLKLYNVSSIGLIWGNLIGVIMGTFLLMGTLLKRRMLHIGNISRKTLIYSLKKYDSFPKFQSLSVLLNAFSINLPFILLPLLYSPETGGFFSLTHRILAIPITLLSSSTRTVYIQKVSEYKNKNLPLIPILAQTLLSLLKFGIVPFILIGFFAKEIFSFGFGEEWRTAGFYAQITMFYYFILFLKPTVDANVSVLRIQKYNLLLQIILVLSNILCLYLASIWSEKAYLGILSYSISGALINIIIIIFVYRKTKQYDTKNEYLRISQDKL